MPGVDINNTARHAEKEHEQEFDIMNTHLEMWTTKGTFSKPIPRRAKPA